MVREDAAWPRTPAIAPRSHLTCDLEAATSYVRVVVSSGRFLFPGEVTIKFAGSDLNQRLVTRKGEASGNDEA